MPTTNQKRMRRKMRNKSKNKPVSRVDREVSALGKALRSLGSAGGSALGALAGAPVAGGVVGNNLGAALSKWLGFGDYTVRTNSVVNRASTGIPMMHKEGQSVTIRHREFIAQVRGSTSFAVLNSFVLNPGLAATFPWLSTIAGSFQEYKFKGIVFHYIPSSGTAVSGTNAALGTVMLQTSYRSSDVAPQSKTELLNEYWSGETVPCDTVAHPIECDPNENPFNVQYVRTSSAVSEGDSTLLYDLGVTHLAVSGQQVSGNTLGDLWVTYEVELKKPIVASNVTSNYLTSSTEFTSPIAGNRLFSGTKVDRGNVLITGSTTLNSFFIEPIRGQWLVNIIVVADTTFTYTGLNILPTTNGNTLPISPGGGASAYGSVGTTAHINAIVTAAFVVIDSSQGVAVNLSGSAAFTGTIARTIVTLTQF